ncbi:3'-5'-exoribonuclease [Elasticomyces elasticus]|nr:3'-5'-exoribonuclease [Elasticomyces elasticus]
MPREAEISTNERDFIRQALRENIRLDGRALDAFRDIELSFGDEYGVADVRLGKTRVVARISAEVTAPFADRKFDGIFTIATELSPLASPAFEVGRYVIYYCLLSTDSNAILLPVKPSSKPSTSPFSPTPTPSNPTRKNKRKN